MSKTLKLKKPAAAKTAAQKENVKANVEKTKAKITEKKDLLYIYPKDVTTLESRKKFRGKARARRDSFLKKIANAEKPAEVNKLRKEANAWGKTIFTKKGMPTF